MKNKWLATTIVSEWWSQHLNPDLSGKVPCSLLHYITLPEVGRRQEEHRLESNKDNSYSTKQGWSHVSYMDSNWNKELRENCCVALDVCPIFPLFCPLPMPCPWWTKLAKTGSNYGKESSVVVFLAIGLRE